MRAASRALAGLLVGLGLLGPLATVSPATAQPTDTPMGPSCPAVVADQPLSVSAPFSGTLRPRAGDDGRIESTSLLCAYGEGMAPAAEVTVAWEAGPAPCATTQVAVAPGLDVAAFDDLASSLAASAGRDCVAAAAGGWPLGAVAGGVIVGGALAAAALLRRRAAPVPAAVGAAPAPVPADDPPVEPVVATRSPDATPVLAALAGRGGRDFARTGAGQLATVAAVAYVVGDSVSGDLARAGSLAALPVRLPPRPELAGLALARAHRGAAVGR